MSLTNWANGDSWATIKTNIAAIRDLVNSIFDDGVMSNGINTAGTLLKTKIVQIGDWDMDATGSVSVTHGIADFTKIRSIDVLIRQDTDGNRHRLESLYSGSVAGQVDNITSTTIGLSRTTAGLFDSATFNATSYNRGWVTITYEA